MNRCSSSSNRCSVICRECNDEEEPSDFEYRPGGDMEGGDAGDEAESFMSSWEYIDTSSKISEHGVVTELVGLAGVTSTSTSALAPALSVTATVSAMLATSSGTGLTDG